MTSIGIAWLDGLSILGTGRASVDGGVVFDFYSVDQLHDCYPQTIFISSVSEDQYNLEIDGRTSWLKHQSFFITSMDELIKELGIDTCNNSIKKLANLLALIVQINDRFMPVDLSRGNYSNGFADFNTSCFDSIQNLEVSNYLRRLMFAEHATTNKSISNNTIKLNLNRTSVFNRALNFKIPNGAWDEVVLSVKNNEDIILDSYNEDLLALVSISKVEPGLLGLIKKNLHLAKMNWVTYSELKLLLSFSKVKVHRLFQCRSSISLLNLFNFNLPEVNHFDYISISSGFFYENFLEFLSATNNIELSVSNGNIAQAWLYSHLRVSALYEAITLSKLGVTVDSLNHTSVSINAPQDGLSKSAIDYFQNNVLTLPISSLELLDG